MRTHRTFVTMAAAVALTAGMSAAPADAATVTGAPGVAAAPAAVTGVKRSSVDERRAVAILNAARKQKGLPPLKANSCVARVANPLAARMAKTRTRGSLPSSFYRALRKCGNFDSDTTWGGGASYTATPLMQSALKNKKVSINKAYTQVGTAVYKDARGRLWIALVQVGR